MISLRLRVSVDELSGVAVLLDVGVGSGGTVTVLVGGGTGVSVGAGDDVTDGARLVAFGRQPANKLAPTNFIKVLLERCMAFCVSLLLLFVWSTLWLPSGIGLSAPSNRIILIIMNPVPYESARVNMCGLY
jgi:hypothetical protein